MGKGSRTPSRVAAWLLMVMTGWLIVPFLQPPAGAEVSLCAQVKIEIKQELTLERQAFDAHMRINNGLTHVSLEEVGVEVLFTDEAGDSVLASSDPDNTEALFFIRVDSMANIDDVDGAGSVPAASTADIHWLIIPAPGASNGLDSGTRYNVGARLTYTIGGEENVTEVTPDYIFVKPMPELTLDYFLPAQVYGDDAFTPEIEPSIPFSLGVRVKNNGSGVARGLKIDSAQPRIVENEQGLLINFVIEGSEVNGRPETESLLVDFGDIAQGTAGVARWIMRCTLSGRFVNFEARFSHADELGGELTSLLKAVETHLLVRDVLVDLPGRDEVRDFLARDGDVYRVYETDSADVAVTDQTGSASLAEAGQSGTESRQRLTCPVTAGFMYVKLTDPHGGRKVLVDVVRSDGKRIKPENAWLSKTRNQEDQTWMHFINLFDANTTDTYTLVFEDLAATPQPPVLQYVPDRSGIEGGTLSFLVEASDPNGTLPGLTAAPLPVGAQFTDNGDGTALFTWTPAVGQKGLYYLTLSASDGAHSTEQTAALTIHDVGDTDMDGMLDAWEMAQFGTLDRDGTGDFDGDGVSDRQEFLDGTDPTRDESAPSAPEPLSPPVNEDVTDPTPDLVVVNSTDRQTDPMTYDFEIYADPGMTDRVAGQTGVPEGDEIARMATRHWLADNSGNPPLTEPQETTTWAIPSSLPDNTRYYWRVRATDGEGYSLWSYRDFFVNTANDPPEAFQAAAPAAGTQVDTPRPALRVLNTRDRDLNTVAYDFEVYAESSLTTLVAGMADIPAGAGGTTAWTVDTDLADATGYHWRAIATDEHGAQTATPVYTFHVNTANHAPGAPGPLGDPSPARDPETDTRAPVLTVANATDADNDPLTYLFEIDTAPSFDTPALQTSGPVAPGAETTAWQAAELKENTRYHWRVKATDGQAHGPWTRAAFFVNQINDAPATPTLKNPGAGAWVETRTPALSVNPATDPDRDALIYQYEIYRDAALTKFVVQGETPGADWTVPRDLRNNRTYYWRARALDEHGVPGGWTPTADFFVSLHYENTAPEMTLTAPAAGLLTNSDTLEIAWTDADPDSNAAIALYYTTDPAQSGTLIVSGIPEDPEEDTYTWDTTALDDGTYYLYAVISDTDSENTAPGPGPVTIDRTAPTVTADPPAGSYDTPRDVTLTTDEDATIHYTTDGAAPTPAATAYTGPIPVTESLTLRYMAVDTAGNQSPGASAAYAIGTTDITVQLTDSTGRPLAGVRVYVFTETGQYTGTHAVTNAAGTAGFDPAAIDPGTYQYRVDYLGHQFWTDPADLPETRYTEVVLPVETAEIDVTTANGPTAGVRVYLFTETGAYQGQYRVTDENGRAAFELPVGVGYRFRADILGHQYWTGTTIQAGGINAVDLYTGGGRYAVTLQKDPETPIPGVRLYLFSSTGSYLGKNQVTGENGRVAFEVPEGTFKVRADYLGYQFWTEPTRVTTDTAMDQSLPHQDITLTVQGEYQETRTPLAGLKVYLFNAATAYQNRNQVTDGNGQVTFSLPDRAYQVRVDYPGQHVWSPEFTGENTPVLIPMADAQVTVTGAGQPREGVRVHVFSAAGAYLNRNDTTDADGRIQVRLAEGDYKFRADYQGSQFWSAEEHLAAHQANPVTVAVGGGGFTYTVQQAEDQPLPGVRCYVFTEAGTYIGLYTATDDQGEARFDLAAGTYTIRVDYLGHPFWSDPVTVPDTLAAGMTIDHAAATVAVTTTNAPVAGARVYLFSDTGAYQGQYRETGAAGEAAFTLPTGIGFKFRANVLGNTYWSDTTTIQEGAGPIALATGGGRFEVTLTEDTPIPGIKSHLFTEAGTYVNQSQRTGPQGRVAFEVPQGRYKIRADYLGYHFWSEAPLVTADTPLDLALPHQDVTITVNGQYQGTLVPLPDVRTYLFSPTGSYLNEHNNTNAAGQVVYRLPERAYQVRADYMGQQFWTPPFTRENTPVNIPMADAAVTVTGAGLPRADISVYVFSPTGQYLNQRAETDAAGNTTFRLPAGEYKIRADYQGNQYWTTTDLSPDESTPVVISVGGGNFALRVLKGPDIPLAGARTYVFTPSGAYLGLLGNTDETGHARFDLADGRYKFRVDYLGYQFWTQEYTVPDTLGETLTLTHQDVTVTLAGTYPQPHGLDGVTLHLFSASGQYVGRKLTTGPNGQAVFTLPDAGYKVRADYLGAHYWTPAFQTQDTPLTLPEGYAEIHVSQNTAPVPGARVYLFSDTDTYLGRCETTGTNGEAGFPLPADRAYKIRVDADGRQLWHPVTTVVAGQVQEIAVNTE